MHLCMYMYVCTVLHTEDRMSDIQAQASDVSRRRWFISWRRTRILKNQVWTKPLPIHASCMHAQLLQSCLTLCDPIDCSPPGSSVHGDSPGKNAGVGFHALLRGSSRPRDQTRISWASCIGRRALYRYCNLGSQVFICAPFKSFEFILRKIFHLCKNK